MLGSQCLRFLPGEQLFSGTRICAAWYESRNTDYVLVPKGRILDAVHALSADGWVFAEGSSVHP